MLPFVVIQVDWNNWDDDAQMCVDNRLVKARPSFGMMKQVK